ncbi:ABC transporter ATP-binding protein [Marinomonas sp. THO17]|uniref:ABC transporter ATP-binding protein n=1 Tax=Marinomonas sp. THO17 TaxID=3149048 RepID=UPI00336BFC0B
MSASIQLVKVTRQFGDVVAVNEVSIDIKAGEFFSMLGPSGSGKTTCLRLIAGFEQADQGSILIHGKEAAHLPPYQRDVNTVFQDYALFPHMTIEDNVAYGLMVKGMAKKARKIRAQEALDMVSLSSYGKRMPGQLSGGQRQRVALARALVNRPKVLLLDEPLGALDQQLREQMQSELKSLQRQLGITFIFVTHDQNEALSMSDRVAVFNQGRIEQVDHAQALYNAPKTRFVAEFVGTTNIISSPLAQRLTQQQGTFSIRPEHIQLNQSPTDNHITTQGTISDILYHGANTRFHITLASGESLSAQQTNQLTDTPLTLGDEVSLSWSAAAMVPLEGATP